jgi:transcription-repair coupling factor (superfamily II helicase)
LDFRSRGVDHVAGRPDLFADEARAFSRRGVAVVTVERPEQLTGFEETMGAHLHGVPLRYECRPIQEGFSWDEAGVALFPAWRVLRRRPPVRRRRVPRFAPGDEAVRVGSPFELTPGDLVIHVDHGLGRFEGLTRLAVEGHEEEFLQLTYAEDGRLYVPVYNLKLVHRYVGGDAARPLDRLGGGEWRRARRRARRAAEKLARALLELYAARAAREGHRFAGDATWEQELAESFPYAETPDQLRAVDEVLADMAGPRPMERLVCGDVGFGKTEVAVRAVLRAVADGKQVAVLVPTTILADQHYATFRERLAAFPVRVEMLSRFRTSRESKAVVAEIAAGRVDVVVGTHRLLSRDVAFANLGLLIVDEEQRFGVAQKEKIKRLSVTVDVLILTATPIPRTLHMALAGLRDLSLIGTAPLERLPIRTTVAPFDEDLIADAVTRELARGGQVFFVHNRVRTIDAVAAYLRDLVPAARFDVAHGQLPERELERIMHDFARRRFDVLVSSAIIEAGLDFPNVNTIIVNRADTFGLSQLHQLRGRVGRSHLRAYAYFLTPPSHALADAARQRLQALREATELGAGFRLAMRDLEIRGAGNILGPEQSGAVAAVGLDLYTQLLGDAVAALKGEARAPDEDVTVHLDEDAFLPAAYVADEGQRLNLYRRLSDAASEAAVARLADELADRFGPPPAPVARLFNVRRIRFYGRAAGFTDVNIRGAEVTVTFAPGKFERSAARAAPPGVAAAKVRSRAGRAVVTLTVEPPAAADEMALALVRAWAGR